MKNIDEIDDNINELILQKSFDKLTASEKEKALLHVGDETQYTALRSTLLAITSSFGAEEEVSLDQELKSDLMQQFEKKFGTSGNRTPIIPLYRKPFFQLAVAASVGLLIFFAFPFLTDSTEKSNQLAMTSDLKASNEASPTVDENVIPELAVGHDGDKSVEEKSKISTTKSEEDLTDDESTKDLGPLKEPLITPGSLDNTIAGDVLIEDANDKSEKDNANLAKVQPKNALETVTTNNGTVTNSKKSKKDENDFLYERVMRERKEAESAKGKKKSNDDELAKNDADKKALTKEEAKVYESAAGLSSDTYPSAPSSTIVNSVNTFVEENKTEMIDLLFTTF